MNKLDRVLATLNHQPVDRCAVLEQLSYNPHPAADPTGRRIAFNAAHGGRSDVYTVEVES
jgi:hypothetical protein